MKRTAHYDGDNPAELSFPASGIDIFATLLLVVMVNHPAFHVLPPAGDCRCLACRL